MKQIYWLDQIQLSDRLLVGEKAFILSQLLQQDCPVLSGFVLGGDFLQEFLRNVADTKPWLTELVTNFRWINLEDYQELQQIAQQSRQAILAEPFPSSWQAREPAGSPSAHSALRQPDNLLSSDPGLSLPRQGDVSRL